MRFKKIQEFSINALGLFFIVYGTFAMDYAIWRGKPEWVWWICYVAMVLIGFGVLLRLPSLIASQLAIITIPQLIWNIDFFYQLVAGKPLWGVTDYFFSEMLPASRIISFEHFILIPLGLVVLWILKLNNKKFWVISITQVTLLYFIIKLFTDPVENVSCVFRSCVSFIPNGTLYPLTWFGLMFVMIAITTGIIIQFLVPHGQLNNKQK